MPKLKTKSGAAKRFSVTGSGKFKRGRAGRRHLLLSNSARTSRGMRNAVYVEKANYDQIKKLLPYG